MKVEIRGDIIPNDDKWVYDWMEQDSTSPQDVQAALERVNGGPLEVYINSGGGDVFAGSEIYESLRSYPGAVKIHVVGIAASAASVILCAGKSDIAPTGMVMLHNVASVACGDYHDMDKSSELLQKANRAIAAAYVEKTGMPEAKILKLMDKETWLTGEEAVKIGLVDAVSQPRTRLLASSCTTIPASVISKIKDIVNSPLHNHAQRMAYAELDLRILKGVTK